MFRKLLLAIAVLGGVVITTPGLSAEPNTVQVVINNEKNALGVQGRTYGRTTPIDKASDPVVGTWVTAVATPDVPSSLVMTWTWKFARDGKVEYSKERRTRTTFPVSKATGRWERNRDGILVTWDEGQVFEK
ncbi:MAG: hypothetical protein HY319_10370 [Armatimonadetes bacterium]|nr:hypothetical protein [Armatimonadota bacterium]